MFLLKKILSNLVYPLPVCLALLVTGLCFLWLTRRKWTGRLLVTLGTALLALLSFGGVASRMVIPLEAAYPPLQDLEGLGQVQWIVVLGGGHGSNGQVPATGRLSTAALSRLVEAIRLHRRLPNTRLLLSGGGPYIEQTNAEVMAEAATALGVAGENLVLETVSMDTEDEAVEIAGVVGEKPFILVTSAMHMRRSMFLFRHMGTHPIAAPTDNQFFDEVPQGPLRFFPSSENLWKTRLAVHEYVGMLWLRLRQALGLLPAGPENVGEPVRKE